MYINFIKVLFVEILVIFCVGFFVVFLNIVRNMKNNKRNVR